MFGECSHGHRIRRDVFKSTSVIQLNLTRPDIPVIDLMPDQKNIATKGHTMRRELSCKLVPVTLAHKAYQQDMVMIQESTVTLEYNNDFRPSLQEKGWLKRSSPDERSGEICEIKDNPWMVGCPFHPEFGHV